MRDPRSATRLPAVRLPAALFLAVLQAAAPGAAEEGMWMPGQMPDLAAQLAGQGLAVPPEVLADLTGPLLGAVISLGGCTASFVSPQGLAVTNHHCAYGAIQYNSTAQRNLLRDGFLAASRAEELPAGPGSRIQVTVAVEDATARVRDGLAALSGRERIAAIEAREKALVAACEEDAGHRCRVASVYGGHQYQLIKQLEIRDVRLVHAPAGPIGNYGGEVDNWMWPRHTGDYAFYRAYVGPDGLPADPDAANVPYRPRHWLRMSAAGAADGDLVLVAGYPGSTSRHRLASEFAHTFGWYYPERKRLFEEWLELIARETAADEEAAIRYASLVAGLSNAAKNYSGQLAGFARLDLVERRRRQEDELAAWIAVDPERRARWDGALDELRGAVAAEQAAAPRDLYYSGFVRRAALLRAATSLVRLAKEREKPDAERKIGYQRRDEAKLTEMLTRLDRTFTPAVDRASLAHFIRRYAERPAAERAADFDAWLGEGAGGLDARLDALYAGTRLGDRERRLAWMAASAGEIEASDDPFLRLAVALYPGDLAAEAAQEERAGRLEAARARVMEAWIAYLASQGRPLYPDANGTLRWTYGTVRGYSPRDGVQYAAFTTAEGIREKDTGADPFDSPPRLLERIARREYGPYADPRLGSLPVNFLTTLDTTGGNSGSPTLNARGELVGLAFDGNLESVISDYDFDPAITRSIHVDARYMLWVMRYVDRADRLLAEMEIAP